MEKIRHALYFVADAPKLGVIRVILLGAEHSVVPPPGRAPVVEVAPAVGVRGRIVHFIRSFGCVE